VVRYTCAPKRQCKRSNSVQSSELAVNDDDDEQDKDGYNGNGDDAVGGHATRDVSMRVEEIREASSCVAVSTGASMVRVLGLHTVVPSPSAS
jgi:hypothetical protein